MEYAEIINAYGGKGIKCALFDFDGTVSLIREGWQQIMIPYFCEVVSAVAPDEDGKAVFEEVREFVDRLTGKQTIYQCMALCDAVEKRGGKAETPKFYKDEYLRRLAVRIADKKEGLASGEISPGKCTLRGAREFLIKLREKGVRSYLASGTDEKDVIYEAALLGVGNLFDGGIHGAVDARLDCSKEAVIKNMLENEKLDPSELVVFGDGYVEIELVHSVGGYAVGVASDEKGGGETDEWKRGRLIPAGADVIVPDFSQSEKLFEILGL